MMKSFQRKRSRSVRVLFISSMLALVGGVAVVASPDVRDAAHRAMLPVWNLSIPSERIASNVIALFRTRASLERDIEALRNEVKQLQLETLELPILRAENERLQELWRRRGYENSLLGRVLARPNVTPYDTFVIDVGGRDGVGAGDIVLVEQVAVGRISSVFANTSIAQLFSAPGVETNVSIATSSLSLTATGLGAGNFIAEVPRGIDILEGDTVVLTDVSERLFAVVERVEAEASDPFQTIRFQLPVTMSKVDFVNVVVDGAYPIRVETEVDAALEPDI